MRLAALVSVVYSASFLEYNLVEFRLIEYCFLCHFYQ